ncbi:MAG: DUF1552 domain-containing protein [Planctomycetota bacterium]
MMYRRISRRTMLRGVGTTMALPFLDAMVPGSALAAPSKGALPKRMAFFYVPNGVHMQDWTPAEEGVNYKLPMILESLAPVQKELLVLTGLTQAKARANGDGAGDHARALATFLTGCQAAKNNGAYIRAGVSVDQVAAQEIGKNTRFASLELGIEQGAQAGFCDSGYSCAYSSNISWRSPTTPAPKEINPRLVFDRLFAEESQQQFSQDRAKREKYKRSVLDLVIDDAAGLRQNLGSNDQRKLDEYLSAIRDIELRIGRAEYAAAQDRPDFPRPEGAPKDYAGHIRLMFDLLALALQTDLTRISTFTYANEGSNRSYAFLGVPEGHHDLSHHGKDEAKQKKIREINKFHIAQFAYLLEKLKSIPEGEGTLLDQCMIVYGSGISDGDRHNHEDLPILLAGKGGGAIDSGRHIVYPKETPLNNLFLSMLDRMGVDCPSLGDSTERLPGLSRG